MKTIYHTSDDFIMSLSLWSACLTQDGGSTVQTMWSVRNTFIIYPGFLQ